MYVSVCVRVSGILYGLFKGSFFLVAINSINNYLVSRFRRQTKPLSKVRDWAMGDGMVEGRR